MLTKRARLNAIKQSKKWQEYRLDWRDPKMPVFAKGKYWEPEAMEKSAQYGMAIKPMPIWTKDPTYNLRRKKWTTPK